MRTKFAYVLAIGAIFSLAGCGGSGSLGGGGGTGKGNPTVSSVSVALGASTLNVGQTTQATCTVTMSDDTTNSQCSISSSNTSVASVSASGTVTANAAGTANITAKSTQDTTVVSSAKALTVNPQASQVDSVSLSPSAISIADNQTTTITPTVTVTGSAATTVNLAVSPSSAGTLSATSKVASGTAVTFTPAGTGAGTATITATSTADATKSATATVTITLRKISISLNNPSINWLPDCLGGVNLSVAQTGMEKGDALYAFPYGYFQATSTPPSTINETLMIGNSYSAPSSDGYTSTCSPGAYDVYISGSDGAESNHVYVPVVPRWNQWAGSDGTDELIEDFAGNQTCKYNLKTGASDGCIPVAGFGEVVDGTNLMSLGGTIAVYGTSNGQVITAGGDPGDQITDFAAKNGLVGYTAANSSGEEKISFFAENTLNSNNVTNYPLASGKPTAITMTEGCGASATQANAFVIDESAPQLLELRATQPSTSGGSVAVSALGSVALSKFAPVSSFPSGTYFPYYVSGWDNSCMVAVLAPVLNSSASGGTTMQLALIDATGGKMTVLGYDNSASIPASAIEMTPDPAGNAVIIAGVDEKTGTSPLVRVSWTLSGTTPTFTTTVLSKTAPVGTYCVGLGVLPSEQVSCSQRDKLYHVSALK